MRLATILLTVCLVALTSTPGLAQRSVYYSVPAPGPRSPLQAVTLREYAKTLSAASPMHKSSAAPTGPAIDSLIAVYRECPMLVVRLDSARLEPMPAAVVDTTILRTMPVARSAWQNPLQRRAMRGLAR
jgi:hypothetical protein